MRDNLNALLKERIRKKQKADVVYFVNSLKTFDPRTKEKDLQFELYPFQVEYARQLVEHIKTGKDLFVEKSRDMGVSWVTLAVILWFWLYEDGFQALIGSRKEDYVDNRQIDSLFGKLDYMLRWCFIDGFDPAKHRTYMKLINPTNGSVILGESANANFSRAGRYRIVFFDELSFWPFCQNSWEAAGDATPCRLAVTTPSPEVSYAKGLRNSGLVKVKTLHWRLHPLKDDKWYEREKQRRTTEEVARELDINWEGSLEGVVYPEYVNCRFGSYPYVPEWPLYVSWDFGLDGTAIGWWQKNPSTGRVRLCEAYYRVGKPIHYFLPLFGKPIESGLLYDHKDLEVINKVKDWQSASHFGDPDVSKRAFQNKEMTSTREVLIQNNIYVQTNTKANDLTSRITETKLLLQAGIEVNETPGTKLWYEAIKSYRYPQRSETSQATSENIKPIHDWSSHLATMSEFFAVNQPKIETPTFKYEKVETKDDLGFGQKFERRRNWQGVKFVE